MGAKHKYRIRNWQQYNKSLIQRGSIIVWFSDDAVRKWVVKSKTGKKGRPFVYSDDAILTALIIRSVFHLPLRALQGFMMSLITLLSISLPIPCYTQISKRSKRLGQKLATISTKRITDVVIDSTGLKVFGEGEWKVRKHGCSKRRTWRKLHLVVSPDSHEIIVETLTDNSVSDCEVYPKVIDLVADSLERVYGDGAYDTEQCYKASYEHHCSLIVPPQRNAVYHKNAPPYMESRNNSCLEIAGFGGDEEARALWKRLKGYHKRSLAETAMFRFKQLFGSSLRNRRFDTQQAEVNAKCFAMNMMTAIGMPISQRVIF
jgi:hypothetical protein